MIHGYHVILGAYGYWLPNDPRGSWSGIVGKWELLQYGRATKRLERTELRDLTVEERMSRNAARNALKYPPVRFTGLQARAIARGFARACNKNNYTVWSCAILPEHTHLVIARHSYKVEQVINLLKGAATRELIGQGIHPLARFAKSKRPPAMWAAHEWKVFLDSEMAIEQAVYYVEQNPIEEDKPPQRWSFVTPFAGLESNWITYH